MDIKMDISACFSVFWGCFFRVTGIPVMDQNYGRTPCRGAPANLVCRLPNFLGVWGSLICVEAYLDVRGVVFFAPCFRSMQTPQSGFPFHWVSNTQFCRNATPGPRLRR